MAWLAEARQGQAGKWNISLNQHVEHRYNTPASNSITISKESLPSYRAVTERVQNSLHRGIQLHDREQCERPLGHRAQGGPGVPKRPRAPTRRFRTRNHGFRARNSRQFRLGDKRTNKRGQRSTRVSLSPSTKPRGIRRALARREYRKWTVQVRLACTGPGIAPPREVASA